MNIILQAICSIVKKKFSNMIEALKEETGDFLLRFWFSSWIISSSCFFVLGFIFHVMKKENLSDFWLITSGYSCAIGACVGIVGTIVYRICKRIHEEIVEIRIEQESKKSKEKTQNITDADRYVVTKRKRFFFFKSKEAEETEELSRLKKVLK